MLFLHHFGMYWSNYVQMCWISSIDWTQQTFLWKSFLIIFENIIRESSHVKKIEYDFLWKISREVDHYDLWSTSCFSRNMTWHFRCFLFWNVVESLSEMCTFKSRYRYKKKICHKNKWVIWRFAIHFFWHKHRFASLVSYSCLLFCFDLFNFIY